MQKLLNPIPYLDKKKHYLVLQLEQAFVYCKILKNTSIPCKTLSKRSVPVIICIVSCQIWINTYLHI